MNKNADFAVVRINKEAYDYVREKAHQDWESVSKAISKIILEHKEKSNVQA